MGPGHFLLQAWHSWPFFSPASQLMALTTLATLKAFLGITTTTQDPQIDALRGAAEQAIKSYCNQPFEPATYTEYYTGSGNRQIILRKIPVSSITTVHLDHEGNFGFSSGAFDSTTLLTSGEDYALDLDGSWNSLPVSFSGILYRVSSFWPLNTRAYVPNNITLETVSSPGNIKVVYTAGYNPIPQDLQYAVCTLVSFMKVTGPLGGFPLEGERLGDYSYRIFHPLRVTLETKPELGSTRQLLSKYRDVPI